ncbi:MAG: hypothetical protein ABIB71_02725 [Candidatus Woesearchaeota archaeon]
MASKKRIPLEKKNAKLIAELERIERTQKFHPLDRVLAELFLKQK